MAAQGPEAGVTPEDAQGASLPEARQPLAWPPDGRITEEWVWGFKAVLERACYDSPGKLQEHVSKGVFEGLIKAASAVVSAEGLLLEVRFCARARMSPGLPLSKTVGG